MEIIELVTLYLALMIGNTLGILTTGFQFPKGLRLLIPFVINGWKSPCGVIYKCNWLFGKVDFDVIINEGEESND